MEITSTPPRAQAAPTGTQAIDRAGRLLTLVLEADAGLTIGALSALADLPKSTTSRLVRSLEHQGLVRRDANDGTVLAGPAIVAYARRVNRDTDLVSLARDLLEMLAEETGETSNLAIPTSRGVEQLDQVEGRYILGQSNWLGRVVPYHSSAAGKCFLAFDGAPLPSGALERLTPCTIGDRNVLAEEIEQVRSRGWGTTIDEIEPGLTALAAPVLDDSGRAIAGLSVSGPTIRLEPARHPEIGSMLARAAADLAGRLGYRTIKEGAA